MDQIVSNYLLYTDILISQKINFVTKVRFSQKRSHMCKNILSCSSKTCNEVVWGDLGVEPLALRRAKSKVVWYSKLLGKDKNSYCRQVFDKEWGKCKLRGRRRKQWKKCVMDIISDMRLTVSSLDSKKALTIILIKYTWIMLQVICMLVCVKREKFRVYRELKEVFECKKYLYRVPDMVPSFCLDLDLVPMG